MKNLIKHLLHALAIEIDLFFADRDIGILANEDSMFRVFRTGVEWMIHRGLAVSSTTEFVYLRILRCHDEAFASPLDPTGIKL